jgi:site-specific recombinase XerD
MSKPKPEPLDPLIEGYLAYLTDVSRRAWGTIKDVRCTLRRVCGGMASLHPDQPLWKLPLAAYLQWLEKEREAKTTPASLAKYLSHTRGLLDYCWRSGRSDRNVLDGFDLQDDTQRTAPKVLTIDEARRLVEACANRSVEGRRDRMIVLLLYGCGLRTDELCHLNVQDVDREQREIFIAHGKGDRQRQVPIPEAVFTELLAYLLERGGKRGPLFRTTTKSCRVASKDVSHVVRLAAERAGILWNVTPKTLRHSYATHLMDRGVDVAVISVLMGHRSPQETGVYLHVLEPRPRDAVRRLDRRMLEGGSQS